MRVSFLVSNDEPLEHVQLFLLEDTRLLRTELVSNPLSLLDAVAQFVRVVQLLLQLVYLSFAFFVVLFVLNNFAASFVQLPFRRLIRNVFAEIIEISFVVITVAHFLAALDRF